MLIQTRTKGDVISVKLASGEEIFGRFVSESTDSITMAKVMKLVSTSEGSVGFTSVLQTSSQEELKFNKVHCLLIAITDEQVKKDYIQFTSGLKIATSDETSLIHP